MPNNHDVSEKVRAENELDFRKMIKAIWKGKLIIAITVAVALTLSGIISFFVMQEKYEARVLVQATPFDYSAYEIVSKDTMIDFLTRLPVMTIETYMQLAKSQPVLEKTIKLLDIKNESGNLISPDSLSGSVIVTNIPNKNQFDIKVVNHDANQAKLIANALVDILSEYITNSIQEQNHQIADYIKRQIAAETAILNEKSVALSEFRLAYGNIDMLKREVEDLISQIVLYEEDLRQAEMQITSDSNALKVLEGAVKTDTAIDLDDFSVLLDWQDSNKNQNEQDSDLADADKQILIKLSSDALSSALISIDINRIQTRLVSTLFTKMELENKIDIMSADLTKNKNILSSQEYIYNAINQDMELAKQAYDAYQVKLKKSETLSTVDVGRDCITVLVAAAKPGQPISPNKKMNLLLATLLGLALGLCIVFVKEYWKKYS
jgi:polysaccharide biosynthesis transport protein